MAHNKAVGGVAAEVIAESGKQLFVFQRYKVDSVRRKHDVQE